MSEAHPTPLRPAAPPVQRPPQQQGGPAKIAAMPVMQVKHDSSLDSLSLVDEPVDATHPSKIKAFGVAGMATHHAYKRPTTVTGQGAVRLRSFHGRLSDEGLDFMDSKINEWLDAHPDIEVKFVTTSIGQFEGKIREPALVLNVWY